MLSKELEILKHISELYKEDVTDEEFMNEMQGKETLVNAWQEAFDGYLLRDVLDAIDEYFAKKNNRTPPRIAQIKAVLNTNHVKDEREEYHEKTDAVEPSIAIKYANQDLESGDMKWFVPDYIEVEKLIRQDRWGFVHNIYKPTLEEFHRCLEYWCEWLTGKPYRCYSKNEIDNMTAEQQEALRQESLDIIKNFELKRLN